MGCPRAGTHVVIPGWGGVNYLLGDSLFSRLETVGVRSGVRWCGVGAWEIPTCEWGFPVAPLDLSRLGVPAFQVAVAVLCLWFWGSSLPG